jgi:hypothetical protein
VDEEDQAGGYPEEDVVSHTRITRFAAPQDPAQALVFLADPELSGYINRHAWRSSTRTTPTPRVVTTRECKKGSLPITGSFVLSPQPGENRQVILPT